jgi:predicted nucleic acid-binding protein
MMGARERRTQDGGARLPLDKLGALSLSTAGEIGAEHALKLTVRGMDLFHVALAIEVAGEAFFTFDKEQAALAEAAGLNVLRLHARKQ